MAKASRQRVGRQQALEAQGAAHPHPETVVDAVETFGFSRPVYYVTRETFDREGLPGLLPRKRGPKRPHKLTEENLAVLAQAVREAERMPSGPELAALLADRCGVNAHPRSILRRLLPYLKEPEKKLR